jgi:hypothetical protein
MNKPDPGAINEKDIERMARETGVPPSPDYLGDLLEKAKEIDKEKALAKEQTLAKAKEKSKDKGRDMLGD